jgi:hypothetical protein
MVQIIPEYVFGQWDLQAVADPLLVQTSDEKSRHVSSFDVGLSPPVERHWCSNRSKIAQRGLYHRQPRFRGPWSPAEDDFPPPGVRQRPRVSTISARESTQRSETERCLAMRLKGSPSSLLYLPDILPPLRPRSLSTWNM